MFLFVLAVLAIVPGTPHRCNSYFEKGNPDIRIIDNGATLDYFNDTVKTRYHVAIIKIDGRLLSTTIDHGRERIFKPSGENMIFDGKLFIAECELFQ